tara:strand:- start:2503 stop:2718 length:216 start_codon:yes stop_codon:yes gene_type:complete
MSSDKRGVGMARILLKFPYKKRGLVFSKAVEDGAIGGGVCCFFAFKSAICNLISKISRFFKIKSLIQPLSD